MKRKPLLETVCRNIVRTITNRYVTDAVDYVINKVHPKKKKTNAKNSS